MDIIESSSHIFKSDSCWAAKAQHKDSKVTQISDDLQTTGAEEEYTECTMTCASKTFMCPNCNANSNRKRNLKRHMKRCHSRLKPNENPIKLGKIGEPKADCPVPTAERKDEDSLTQDPGYLISDSSASPSSSSDSDSGNLDKGEEILPKETLETSEASLLEEHLIRKKTMSFVPFTKKRTKKRTSMSETLSLRRKF
jgi:hypothetical protein